jgi:hypothetical protein
LRQPKGPDGFVKTPVEILKNSGKLQQKLVEINGTIQSFVLECVKNPQKIQDLGLDTEKLTATGWINVVLNFARGRFGKEVEPRYKIQALKSYVRAGSEETTYGGITQEGLEAVYEYGQSLQRQTIST